MPWPAAPADPDLLLPDPEPTSLAEPADRSGGAPTGWAAGALDPTRWVAASHLGDPGQRWMERFWLASFDQLTHTRIPAALPAPRRGVIDLTVPLSMLMGLTQLPGDLAGWGPVIAEIARSVAAEPATHGHASAQWRYSVTNKFGEVVHHGTLHRRPTAADIAFIKARDRTCRAPGCRRAVRGCDVDHTRDWVHSNDSRRCNLACLCRRHHRFKHETGAELIQLGGGGLAWITPYRLHYTTHPYRQPTHLEPAHLLVPT